jgi:hypothetical protein
MRESAPPAPASTVKTKPSPCPKAAQTQNAEKSATSPPKHAQAINTAPSGDKNIPKSKKPDGWFFSSLVTCIEEVALFFYRSLILQSRGIPFLSRTYLTMQLLKWLNKSSGSLVLSSLVGSKSETVRFVKLVGLSSATCMVNDIEIMLLQFENFCFGFVEFESQNAMQDALKVS